MLAVVFLLLNIFFALLIFYLTLAFFTGAPYVPSNKNATKAMIRLSKIKKGMKVYDLGSGDGKLLILSAQMGAKAVGYEINPYLVLLTNLKLLLSPYQNHVSVKWKNMWQAHLEDADIVFVYLLPWKMKRLENMLKKELKTGSIVVSNSYIFPDWKILRKDTNAHVYVFRI